MIPPIVNALLEFQTIRIVNLRTRNKNVNETKREFETEWYKTNKFKADVHSTFGVKNKSTKFPRNKRAEGKYALCLPQYITEQGYIPLQR